MTSLYDPESTDHLTAQRERLGDLYADAVWAQRAFEQEAKNTVARAEFDALYPAMVRLYELPAPKKKVLTVVAIADSAGNLVRLVRP